MTFREINNLAVFPISQVTTFRQSVTFSPARFDGRHIRVDILSSERQAVHHFACDGPLGIEAAAHLAVERIRPNGDAIFGARKLDNDASVAFFDTDAAFENERNSQFLTGRADIHGFIFELK